MGYNREQCDWKDYHIHSCFSDGELTPEQIVDRWSENGYKSIAITDHDGIEGSLIAYNYARANRPEIQVIPGIEFDSTDELSRQLHILGYGMDYENPKLKATLSSVLLNRAKRNDELIRIINELGYKVSIDELIAVNDGRFVGKPTIARVLVNKGYFSSISEVFDKLLDVHPAIRQVRKQALSSKEVVKVIHAAGGIAVMAHPMELLGKGEQLEDFLPRLVEIMGRLVSYGIDGIECYHPSATDSESRWLCACAEKNGLVITSGSDFHSDQNIRIYK